MVMADRPDVPTASTPITAVTLLGLAENLANAVLRVPFRRPWEGPSGAIQNVGSNTTRQVLRSFMGYSVALPIEEFRSMEKLLDDVCRAILPPYVRLRDGVTLHEDVAGGIPGLWIRPEGDADPAATILYLHGGGYIGTSPAMYTAFVGALVKGTGCEVFVADYRLAPEFPYPAGLDDARDAYDALLARAGTDRLLVAGDSGGGGLATSLVEDLVAAGRPAPFGLVLFSPEIDLDLDDPSVTENAPHDILPWNIPVTPYLHGVAPADGRVSAARADVSMYPPTIVAFGDLEMFRDGIRRFVENLERSGVYVESHEEEGMYHVFPILMPWADAAKRTFAAVDAFVGRCRLSADPVES
jgi:acetyl esterase/lipase